MESLYLIAGHCGKCSYILYTFYAFATWSKYDVDGGIAIDSLGSDAYIVSYSQVCLL